MPNLGLLYIEARKVAGVEDGFGINSIEVIVREYLLRAYTGLRIGQLISLSERNCTKRKLLKQFLTFTRPITENLSRKDRSHRP
jgi:hypothetical protein